MKNVRRVGAATVVAVVLATACAALLPAAPVAAVATPTLTLFRGETLATDAEGTAGSNLNRLRATLVINHPVGVTVSQMRRRTQQGVGFTAYGAVEGTVRTISGVSGNYSVVEAAWVPSTSSWGGCFTSSVRWCDRIAEVDIKMSDGTELGGDWTYRAQTEVQSNGNADPPTMYNNFDTTVNGSFTGSGSLRLSYACDDNDGSGSSDDECDNVAIRVRNIASGATTLLRCDQSTVNCENGVKFNADDGTQRSGNIPLPTATGRGRFTIEGMFCNEDQRAEATTDCSSRGSGWQWMGSYTFNPGAPTVTLVSTSFTGGGTTVGGVLRPNTGATVNYTANATADAQVALWDLNNDGTGETVELGESVDPGAAPQLAAAQLTKSKDTTGLTEGSSCQLRVQVRDNGGLNAADVTSALSAQVSTTACTVNRQPTGAGQTGLNVTKGVALPITLGNADGDSDPRTCELVGTAVNGSVNLSGAAPSTGCSASFTAAADTSGTASFQYRVLDDHDGVSPTYTISMAIQNRAPTSAAQAVTVPVNDSTVITLGGSDPDGDTTTCAVTAPTGGTVSSGTSCTRAYVAPSTPGTYTFTYTRSDAFGGTSPSVTITITVEAVPGVRGQVTSDETGQGIAGVTVRLYQDGMGFTSYSAVTDAQGAYDLGDDMTAGSYRVIFKDPDQDYVDEWYDDSLVRSTSTPITFVAGEELLVDAGLATGAEIDVSISNPGPFTVGLYNAAPSGASAYRSVPNVAGSTTFRGLPAGTYYVSVTDPADLLAQEWSGNQTVRASAGGVPVATGETVETSFTLATRNTIAGTIIDSEGPVPLLTVQAYGATSGAFVKSTKTDAQGEYVLRDLAPGGYKLAFRDATGAHPVTWFGGADVIGSAAAVTMAGGGALTADEEIPLVATVSGTVTGGPGGLAPLVGAKVTLYRNGAAVRTYVTDGTGTYRATGLAPGDYAALFTATGHRSEYNLDRPRKADADIVIVGSGAEVTLDATLAPV
ncbi:MAG TPA: carboxypeptidase regulatory-like domain-containing protein [Iamia sp.]|nr:carboxypeptidase regulatory-like domain-containing protein [Iamia sp.]